MKNRVENIIIFGYYKSFDYYKIGGLESYYRRLSKKFITSGLNVMFVFYGSEKDYEIKIEDNLGLYYFESFNESLKLLLSDNNLVFDNYILKKDRLKYLIFRKTNSKKVLFGRIFSGLPSNLYLKFLSLEYKLFSYNGPIISLSKTIQKKLNEKSIYSKIVLPPLSDKYFTYDKRIINEKTKITFIGRFDENKGIYKVLDLFEKLSLSSSNFEFVISGYFAHGKIDNEKFNEKISKIDNLIVDEKSWVKWSIEMDKSVINLLKNTDILVLPYKNLDGTMDPPLLLLEGMAAGCIIFTTDVGSVKEIYTFNEFYSKYDKFDEDCYEKIIDIVNNKNEQSLKEKINKRILELDLNSFNIDEFIDMKKVSNE